MDCTHLQVLFQYLSILNEINIQIRTNLSHPLETNMLSVFINSQYVPKCTVIKFFCKDVKLELYYILYFMCVKTYLL